MWKKIQIARRRRIWKKRSKTHLLRNPGFQHVFSDASTDLSLLDKVEKYGRSLLPKLEDVLAERRFVYDLRAGMNWDGGEADMADWLEGLRELLEDGLVVKRGEEGYALSHAARSQLHSLRTAEKAEIQVRLANRNLRIAIAALAVSVVLQCIHLSLTIWAH